MTLSSELKCRWNRVNSLPCSSTGVSSQFSCSDRSKKRFTPTWCGLGSHSSWWTLLDIFWHSFYRLKTKLKWISWYPINQCSGASSCSAGPLQQTSPPPSPALTTGLLLCVFVCGMLNATYVNAEPRGCVYVCVIGSSLGSWWAVLRFMNTTKTKKKGLNLKSVYEYGKSGLQGLNPIIKPSPAFFLIEYNSHFFNENSLPGSWCKISGSQQAVWRTTGLPCVSHWVQCWWTNQWDGVLTTCWTHYCKCSQWPFSIVEWCHSCSNALQSDTVLLIICDVLFLQK